MQRAASVADASGAKLLARWDDVYGWLTVMSDSKILGARAAYEPAFPRYSLRTSVRNQMSALEFAAVPAEDRYRNRDHVF